MQETQVWSLGLEDTPGEGNGSALQYSCLENPIDRGAWQSTVHGVARVGYDLMTKPPQMFFWNSLVFFGNPVKVGNSGSSAFSKTGVNIWEFMVHVLLKPGLENFERYFTSVWDECNCTVVWAFFGIAFLWDWNENWPFPVLWPLLSFPNLLAYWVHHFHSIIYRIWNSSTGIPSPPLALFVVMLSKAHLTSHSRMSGFRWVITPLWLSGSWRSFFVQFFCVFLPPLLNIFCFC